jgi:hypothetical protein
MPYNGNHITDLDVNTPNGALEAPSALDDALREIKRVIKNDVVAYRPPNVALANQADANTEKTIANIADSYAGARNTIILGTGTYTFTDDWECPANILIYGQFGAKVSVAVEKTVILHDFIFEDEAPFVGDVTIAASLTGLQLFGNMH